MKYPKIREIGEALTSLLSPAYTTRYPHGEYVPFKKFRGKPVVDDAQCVGCETCANVCPSGAITFRDDKEGQVRVITRDFGKCIFCGQCEEHCITKKGVRLSDTIYDMAVFDRHKLLEVQEKQLLTCSNCKSVITTKEHVLFIYNRIGPLAFSSLLCLNVINETLELAPEEDVLMEVKDGLKRKDMFNVICPKCLRKTLITLT